ncbi:MAG TPA: nucleoside monophosphate kinase [Acidimicrobiia bacterium]|nr:nucleoside monophosphate kinase [Acidimicrobiia bacterium]
MIITISGRPGSGKSVVASRVAEALGIQHVSAGDFMREMAAERGISILQLSRLAEADAEIDAEIDGRTSRLAAAGESFVIDARLGWHFVPESLKVFLDVRPDVAAARIYEAGRGTERENVDLETTRRAVEERSGSETERYMEYYGLDYTDPGQYDLVIDTSDLTIDEVIDLILARHRAGGGGSRAEMR